uniref:Uncharacterized protein n=1 Tax=Cyanothece sp. (strain PCC 7425 / ATCC 29141) TaxID=395961 RepID=B8HMW6_CYAP4
MPSDPSYSIADVRALLSQRVGLDLSPVELAEILWLALQRGVVIPEDLENRKSPIPPTQKLESESESEPLDPTPTTDSSSPKESIPIVAEPPETRFPETAQDSDQAVGSALPINIPETVALRNRQAIARSLRPLMRKVASKQRRILDEEATVIQIAETQTWSPVLKPEPERWLELAIVIEVTNLLDVWQDTIAEFQRLMERHGAFRNVRTWQLKPNAQGEPQLFLQTSRGLRGSPRSPRELLDPSGRRQILLLSDCTSRAWRTGKIPKLLKLWSRENPVAIVQLLPEHYWDRSALKASYRVALKSRRPGALSRDWGIEGLSPQRRQQLPQGLKLPVVTVQPESLGQWAKAIAASSDQPTMGILFNRRGFQAPPSVQETPLTAKQLVQRFRNTASEKAQELADMMAVLPVNWSVIRLIQKNLVREEPLQETGALYLAEIFLSGLLRPATIGSEQPKNHKIKPQYDFVDGVRDVLLGTIPISEAQAVGEEIATAVFKQLPSEVQERVNADIERRFGDSLSYFEAFLIPDLPWGEKAAAEVFPFAQVTGQVLRRWGGDYAALAEELERQEVSNKQQEERYLDESTIYAALEQQLDYLQWKIGDIFILEDHQFELYFLGLRPSEIAAEPHPEEIIIAENEEISIVITDRTLIGFSEDSATFELAVRINFSVEISYPDFEQYVPDLELVPTYKETVSNQSAYGIAEVALSFLEEDEVEPELVELRVHQPIQIDPSQHQASSLQIPRLQTFR